MLNILVFNYYYLTSLELISCDFLMPEFFVCEYSSYGFKGTYINTFSIDYVSLATLYKPAWFTKTCGIGSCGISGQIISCSCP